MANEPIAPTLTDLREEPAALPLPTDAVLRTVDRGTYRIERELARGGMGRIFTAIDLRLLREVAVKEVLATGEPNFRRFEREALLTAQLQHPNIVAVYEGGRWPSGEPFYAMRLVPGRPLHDVIDATTKWVERLALLPNILAIAEALAYAHAKGVIHRDLKPQNVLVGTHGETVVIDWGLAKRLSDIDDDSPLEASPVASHSLTEVGAVMGTPRYMPPEQADGARVDERADVYAIGAILYHLLVGSPPYQDSATPSVLAMLAERTPPTSIAKLVPQAPADLVAIVARAMSFDATKRHPTAQQLAEDLRRFQTGQLVGSHTYTTGELARRWMRKHRVIVASAAIALGVLAVVGAVSYRQVLQERDRATEQRGVAERATQSANAARASEATLAEAQRVERARRLLDVDPTAALAWLKSLAPTSTRFTAAALIAEQAIVSGVSTIVTIGEPVIALVPSGDTRTVWVADKSGGVTVVDTKSHAKTKRGTRLTRSFSVTRDGAVAVGMEAAGIAIWTAGTVTPLATSVARPVAVISPDGGRLVYTAKPGSLALCEPPFTACRDVPLEGTVLTLDVTDAGDRLLVGMADKAVVFELTATGVREIVRHPIDVPVTDLVRPAAWTSDGRTLVWISLVDGQRTVLRSIDNAAPTTIGVCEHVDEELNEPGALQLFVAGNGNYIVCHYRTLTQGWDTTRRSAHDPKRYDGFAMIEAGVTTVAAPRASSGFAFGTYVRGILDTVSGLRLQPDFEGSANRALVYAGDTLISGGDAGDVRFWTVQTGSDTLFLPERISTSRRTGVVAGVNAGHDVAAFVPDHVGAFHLEMADAQQTIASETSELVGVIHGGKQLRAWWPVSGKTADIEIDGIPKLLTESRVLVERGDRIVITSWDGHQLIDARGGKPDAFARSPELDLVATLTATGVEVATDRGARTLALPVPGRSIVRTDQGGSLVINTVGNGIVVCGANDVCGPIELGEERHTTAISSVPGSAIVILRGNYGERLLDTTTGKVSKPRAGGVFTLTPDQRYALQQAGGISLVDEGTGDEIELADGRLDVVFMTVVHWGTPRSGVVIVQLNQYSDSPLKYTTVMHYPLGRLPRDASLLDVLAKLTNARIVNEQVVAD